MRVFQRRRRVRAALPFLVKTVKVFIAACAFLLVFLTLYSEKSDAQFLSRPCAVTQAWDCPFATRTSLGATVARTPSLSLFAQILAAAQWDEDQESGKQSTLFVPTNDALTALPTPILSALTQDHTFAKRFVAHHLVAGAHPLATQVSKGSTLSRGGSVVDFVISSNHVSVRGAAVLQPDIVCTNGLIHIVDKALVPEFF